MKPSELIKLLEPFCKEDPADEIDVLIATAGALMPVAPDAVQTWSINGKNYPLIFRDPNRSKIDG